MIAKLKKMQFLKNEGGFFWRMARKNLKYIGIENEWIMSVCVKNTCLFK